MSKKKIFSFRERDILGFVSVGGSSGATNVAELPTDGAFLGHQVGRRVISEK